MECSRGCICLSRAPQTCCRYDDEIFEHITRDFPEFAAAPHAGLVTLDEDWMKSEESKERWRTFINAYVPCPSSPHHPACLFNSKSHAHAPNTNRYEKKITDFNFGSLIRTDSTKEYSETNTIFGELDLLPGWGVHNVVADGLSARNVGTIVTRIQVRCRTPL